jgi:NAD(P)H-dependent FMN reductase
MITIISGTNRPDSLTAKFAGTYLNLMQEYTPDVQLFTLENLSYEVLCAKVYEKEKHNDVLRIQNLFRDSDAFVFIFPEYNGSYPGVLKLLIDVMDPKIAFNGKKAGMIGISTGRAGNLRGMDHLAAVLQHMNVTLMPYFLPVSRVHQEMNAESLLTESTEKVVRLHINRMLSMI